MAGWTVPGYTGNRVLGSGEAGLIVEAVHDASGVRVTITYPSERLRSDEAFRERFSRDAELLAGLDHHHPNLVRVRELVTSGTELALITEAVEGAALRRVLATSGPLPPEAALAVLRGSLLGLGAAAEVGVAHRDYQPSDVLITPEGVVKVVGFGLAVRTEAMMPAAGAPSYMAPELWEGAAPGLATDLYAATATFYECLTGQVPYSADSVFELQTMHRAAPIPVTDVPGALAPLLAQGLAKTAAERPSTASEFLAEVEAAAVVEFGLEWEERGRLALAALVAALPEEDAGVAEAAPAAAGEGMGRGTKVGIAAAVIVVIGAAVAAVALSPGKHSAAAGPSGAIVSAGSGQGSPADDGATPGLPGGAPTPGSSSGASSSPATTTGGPTTSTTGTSPGPTSGTASTPVNAPLPTMNSLASLPDYPPSRPPTTGATTPTGSTAPPSTPSPVVTVSASASMTKSTYSGPCPPTDPPTGTVTFTVAGLPGSRTVPITYHWRVVGSSGTDGTGSGKLDAHDGSTTQGFTVPDDQHTQNELTGTVEITWTAPGTPGGTTDAGSVDITCVPSDGGSSGGPTSGG